MLLAFSQAPAEAGDGPRQGEGRGSSTCPSSRLRWFVASLATIFVPELAIAVAHMASLPDVLSMRPTPLLSPTPRATARGLLNLDGSDAGRAVDGKTRTSLGLAPPS